MKKINPFLRNRYEIIYTFINSCLAGLLVLLGSFSSGIITKQSLLFASIAGAIVIITQLKRYLDSEEKEYCTHLFKFI